jgi:hypothetical protein
MVMMPANEPKFRCSVCGNIHGKQIFVSHSRADVGLLEEIKSAICAANVAPFLYAAPEDAPASWDIIREIQQSMALMAVLGPEVAHRPWTQVWIGFEIGVFTAFQAASDLNNHPAYKIPHTFLIEDVRQTNDAPIPFVDLALLLDFSNRNSWTAVRSITELINDDIPSGRELFARANSLRLFHVVDKPDFRCSDPQCLAKYELMIWVNGCERDTWGFPILPDTFSIKCVVCRKTMNVATARTTPGNPQSWSIGAPDTAPHISSFLRIS